MLNTGQIVKIKAEPAAYARVVGRTLTGPGWVVDNREWRTVATFLEAELEVVA